MSRSSVRRLALAAAVTGLAVLVVVPAATGGTGVGSVFNLGRTNSVSKVSVLTGSTDSRMLQVTNGGSGSALALTTRTNVAPLKVNSSVKVANLNADKLDGLDSSAFMPAGTKPDADTLDGLDSSAFLPSSGSIAISANRSDWLVTNSAAPLTADYGDAGATRFTRSAAGYNYLRIGADMPVVLLGQELALTAVDLCYGASAAAELSDVWVYRSTAATDLGVTTQALTDATDRTDAACRRYVPAVPVALSAADSLTLRVGVSWDAGASFYAGRVTFHVEPTGNVVAPAAQLPVVQLEKASGKDRAED